ncbi:MAG: SbcC/MukB-like Walker B domain-containing protein, partial [Bacteroidia bacterium]
MIPVKLIFEGLYSYQSKQEIDFEQLTSAQLFGIFGVTGGGKSSILEAMMFALYGKSERMGKTAKSSYNMMNLKSDKLMVDFTFRVGEQAQDYFRFVVSIDRNKKNFEDVKTAKRATYQQVNQEWQPIEKSAEQIVGLSYDNFRRTIIIPQGQFQEFLQLGGKDRTAMLREIFHLEKYNLAEKSARLETQNNLQVAAKKAQIQQLAEASEGGLANLREELTEKEQQRKERQKQIKELEIAEKLWDERKKSFQEQQQLKQELATLQANQAAMELRESVLKQYKYCVQVFKADLDLRTRLTNEHEELEKRSEQKKALHEKKEQEHQADTKVFVQIEQEYLQRNVWQEKIKELRKILEIREIEQKVQATQQNLAKGETLTAEKKAEVAKLKQAVSELEQQIVDLRKTMPDVKELLEMKEWFQKLQQLTQTQQMEQRWWQEKEAEAKAILQEKGKLLEKMPLLSMEKTLSFAEINTAFETEKEIITLKINQLEHEQQQLLIKKELKNYANQLIDGEPCPLCGAIHHPAILSGESVEFQLKEGKKELTQAKTSLQQLEKTQTQLSALEKQFTSISQQIQAQKSKLQQAEEALATYQTTFVWEENLRINGEQYIDNELNNVKQLETKLANLAENKRQKMKSLEDEEKAAEKFTKRLQELKEEETKWAMRFQAEIKLLINFSYADYQQISKEAIEKEIYGLEQKYSAIEKSYLSQKSLLQKRRDEMSSLLGELTEMEKRMGQILQDVHEVNQQLAEKLKSSRFSSYQEILQILQKKLLVEREENEIEQFKVKLQATQRELEKLNAQLEGLEWNEVEYKQLKNRLLQMRQENEAFIQQIGVLQEQISAMQQNLTSKAIFENELIQLENRANNLAELRKLFRSEGFVNYVSTIFLQNLCKNANERFKKLSKNHLHLEITEDNDFQVRDYLNDGKMRSVKTLSGGQTFQAALSLALALSDSVQKQAQASQNFFFIDEGFGSQDKASLKMIFDTLQSLRQENRIVGIISHVEDLQQEIEVFLSVQNDTEL